VEFVDLNENGLQHVTIVKPGRLQAYQLISLMEEARKGYVISRFCGGKNLLD
jgi:hypothetical protein